MFLTDLIRTGGVETDGPLPDIDEGGYYLLDFSETNIYNINPETRKTLEIVDSLEGDSKVAYSTSLRLEFLYNDIFKNAGEDYISKNFLYGIKYSDPEKIVINNIYKDTKRRENVTLIDVQKNNLNIRENLLYLDITYDGVHQQNLVLMPTGYVGMETFNSRFLNYKLTNGIRKNEDIINPWDDKTHISNAIGDTQILDIDTSLPKLQYNDLVYDNYKTVFEKFYLENTGDNKEYLPSGINPFENFALIGMKEDDQIFPPIPGFNTMFNSYNYTLDTKAVTNEISSPLKSSIGSIEFGENYLSQLFVFLKNIVPTTKNPNLQLPRELLPDEYKELYDFIQTFSFNQTNPEQFYLMFLPKDKSIGDLINDFFPYLQQVINGEKTFSELFEEMKDSILNEQEASEFSFILDYSTLPFQLFSSIETKNSNSAVNTTNRFISQNRNLYFSDETPGSDIVRVRHNKTFTFKPRTSTLDSEYDFMDINSRHEFYNEIYANDFLNYGMKESFVVNFNPEIDDKDSVQNKMLKMVYDNIIEINNNGLFNAFFPEGFTYNQFLIQINLDTEIDFLISWVHHDNISIYNNTFEQFIDKLSETSIYELSKFSTIDLIFDSKEAVEPQYQSLKLRFDFNIL